MNQILYTLSISLFDSLSTTFQIIIFALMFTTAQPLRNALSYLMGLSGAYFGCGLLGYLALDQLRQFASVHFPSLFHIPDSKYYETEFLTGFVMTVLGIGYFYWKRKRGWSNKENYMISKLKAMNGWFAFGVGVLFSVTSFPTSLPYFVAIGRYASLHLDFASAAEFILLYNLGFALPMFLLLVIYLFARQSMDLAHDQLHEKAHRLNLYLTTWTLVVFGLFMMIDAGCYFIFGHALLKERYF
jgi:cytochrome c biogenesis protein CcdA